MKKKLYRSSKNKMIVGVCAGIAEFFHIDPTIVRCVVAAASVFTGLFPAAAVYALAAILIPLEPVKASEAEIVISE